MTPARGRPRTGATLARSAPVEAVTSDLWYTLIYVRIPERRRIEVRRRRVWSAPLVAGGLSRDDATRALSRLAGWIEAEDRRGRAPSTSRQVDWLTARLAPLVSLEEVPDQLDAIVRQARIDVAPGALAALGQLRDRGVRLGLISDLVHETSRAARSVLGRLSLDEYFDSMQFSPDLPWSKPNPGAFLRCLRDLRVRPAAAVHVGDRLADVVGARRAGMRSVLYTGLHRFEPEEQGLAARRSRVASYRARTWAEVPRILPLRGPAPH